MEGISVAESGKHKRIPKVVKHLEIHPGMKADRVEAHHTHSYEHPEEVKEFQRPHEPVSLPKGHILHHVAKHLGVPIEEQGGSEPEPIDEE